MKIFVGDTRKKTFVEYIKEKGISRVYQNHPFKPYMGEFPLIDNGAYENFMAGRSFDAELFYKHIESAYRLFGDRVSFAVTPDIVQGGMDSLRLSNAYIDGLKNHPQYKNWKWYLSVQDGMTTDAVYNSLYNKPYDGVFIGGSDKFKFMESRNYIFGQKWPVHFGRCSTLCKLAYAHMIGCNSADTSFCLWDKTRFGEFIKNSSFFGE